MENCWISTTGSTPETIKPKAVFGNPTDATRIQLVNSYYPETVGSLYDGSGRATPMSPADFHNGTVAYQLNGFYLNKRYWDSSSGRSVLSGLPAENKTYTSTFLWDYYYKYNSYDDARGDDYQEADDTYKYYSEPHTHEGYAYQQGAMPYVIGFPGTRYYEFDLSGQFEAQHTALPAPARLSRQVVSFVSVPGVTMPR